MPLTSANLGLVSQSDTAPLVNFPSVEDQRLQRFELMTALQASLDIDGQLKIFFRWVSEKFNIESLSYEHGLHLINIQLGNEAKHQCQYALSTDNENLGQVSFTRSDRFSEEELAKLEATITALLFPVRNALKYHVAVQTALHDPLTGTGNRIALDNALHRECQLAERYDQHVSLLVVDIDHFKKVNDTYGHSVGDEVLKQVAKSLRLETREIDMTFRYGGEEFVVVLSKTDLQDAEFIAERLRRSIERLKIKVDKKTIQVTVSIGASKLHQQENIKNLFDRADQALYLAKENGRNCVISN